MKYEQRLKVYGLTDLKTRRERGDLIQFYKSMIESVNKFLLGALVEALFYLQNTYIHTFIMRIAHLKVLQLGFLFLANIFYI